MSTTVVMTDGGLGRGCRRKVRKIPKRPSIPNISKDEFLLRYDVNTSKNPDFPHENYDDLNDIDDSRCLSEFRFRKSELPDLPRPYIFLTTLHVDKENIPWN